MLSTEELLKLKNKDFIYTCLDYLANNKEKSKEAFELLTDTDVCKRKFDMNYAILQEVSAFDTLALELYLDSAGYRRYYPEPYVTEGKRFLICNDWYYNTKTGKRDTRSEFLDWVLGNVG